ncbi:glycosyltransferase family 4 protein [Pseudoduganella armeniaca]|uniref:Glycosyl transferase family 1 n=1 Tax=Pseudoduganella armeniaca TaxID=2072590 RepID=A0A2R4C669_9BURK|nr:glycosyltransferase family 4 protein [Pseudoduganella armeniaca]AVR95095.1 glycosyl transferase family 1 [Pseudoduganella armeniaca]
MRVLHFYKTYFPESRGGVEQVIRQMCVGTSRLGVTNEVLTLTRGGPADSFDIDGHLVHRVPQAFEIASNSVSFGVIGKLAELARQADVIHYHFPWPYMDLAHFMARVDKPSVVTYHSDIVRQKALLKLYSPLMHRFLASVDAIVATSPNYFASSEILKRYNGKVHTIPFGLDKSTYPLPRADLLDKWRARVGERFFLFVGVLRYYKGLHILLDAMARLDYPVVIVGAGPIEQELKQHAARLGLTHVQFVGAVDEDDKVALLTLCYAMAFPSHLRSEAFGISLLEGAMYGKPMISSEIGTGTTYINSDGETGLVVPPSDPDAFAAAMRKLWEDPQLAADMGRRAEARYWQLFAAEKMAQDYLDLYHRLVG